MKRLIILQILFYASVTALANDPNLVGWWTFDEGTGTTTYDSADSRDGIVYGATWATGQIGGALSFDGVNDYAALPDNNPIWLPQNDFTVSAWVRFDRDPQTTHEFILQFDFNYYTNQDLCIGYVIYRSSGNGKAVFQLETATASNALASQNTLVKDTWYHIVGVRNGTTQEIYLNGLLNASGSCSAEPIKFSSPINDFRVNIGVASDGGWTSGTYFLDGMSDDVRIYNRALSAEEIQQLYEGSSLELTGLEITGPDEVAENSTASYKAIAHYDNGATKDITALAEWQVEPNTLATIEAGQLMTEQVLYPKQDLTVYAQYTEDETAVDAEKKVSVLAICLTGSALKFDGQNDFVSVPDNAQINITGDITISAWIWLARGGAGDDFSNQVIVAKTVGRGARDNPFDFRTEGVIPHLTLVRADASGHEVVYSGEPISLRQWHHVLVKVENKVPDFYVDGVITAKSVTSFTKTPTGNTKPLLIGRRDNGLYFDGIMDDVRIYNRAISADEITDVMFRKPVASEPDLIAYWDFDEGEGQVVGDVSGNGNDGILGSISEPDAADPCWVESEVPMQCTTEQVIFRNLVGATENKELANELIAGAKAKELASTWLINNLRRQLKGKELLNAIRAKSLIHIAIVQEDMASRQINMTIERLEEALCLLGYEEDPESDYCGWPWPNCSHNQINSQNNQRR